jgi:hypothetical protein
METVYADIGKPVGFSTFLPMVPAHGTMMSRHRAAALDSEPDLPDRIAESTSVQPAWPNFRGVQSIREDQKSIRILSGRAADSAGSQRS